MIRWRRKKPGGLRGQPSRLSTAADWIGNGGEPDEDGPVVEEAEPDSGERADSFETMFNIESESDFLSAEEEEDGEYPQAGELRRAFGGPGERSEVRFSEPAVVSTLLSRKPGRSAALAVGWTLGVILAVSTLYWWGPPGLAEALPASGDTVFARGETWRLLTSMAAHADAIHLLSNAVFLTWLIYLSFGAFGQSLYPWAAIPAAALSLAVTLEGYPPNIRVVGASGLLYLLAGSWLTLYVLVERRLSLGKRIVRVVGFFLVVLVPTSIRPEVSYRAHGIGLFFGICLGLAYFLARRDAIRNAERWEWDDE